MLALEIITLEKSQKESGHLTLTREGTHGRAPGKLPEHQILFFLNLCLLFSL